jgi:DNA polymerase elongation subunit (family B)
MSIVSKDGRRAELVDFGYGLKWTDGHISTRVASDILCFVTKDTFPGIISELEVQLKADRKAAKKKMFAAEIAGDKALQIFFNNLQASIKVVMNGLYGGLGSKRGGLFPAGFKLAAAITSEGRHLICTVKQTVERFCWIKDADTFGIGEERPEGAEAVRIVYGDTDSVFMWLKGLNLEAASGFSERISKFFNGRLPPPHDLEFEKIYYPYLLYKKKMYSGLKYEPGPPPLNLPLYDPGNTPKVHSRGLSVVRRDNAMIIKTTMTSILKMTTTLGTTRNSILDAAASAIVATKKAALRVHNSGAYNQFICSAGISKALDSYDHPVAAVEIAKQMMAENESMEITNGTRVTFVVAAALRGAKRAEQAILLETLKRQKIPLDEGFYCEALMKKLGPLLSVFFVGDELVRDAFGELVRARPKTKAEASILPGQRAAEAALRARISELSVGSVKAVDAERPVAAMELRQAPQLAPPAAKRAKPEPKKLSVAVNPFTISKRS